MSSFEGFKSTGRLTEIPENFFTEVIPEIRDLYALKILLLAFNAAGRSEAQVSFIRPEQIRAEYFEGEEDTFIHGLEICIGNQWLLTAAIPDSDGTKQQVCLLNTPKNAAALDAIKKGKFKLSGDNVILSSPPRLDIFKLYEENIGPLTPIIADTLKDLEENYSLDWITKAIQTAVRNNARSLRYIEVVLQNWQEEGKNDRTDRRRRKETDEEFNPDRFRDGDFFDN